MVSRSKNQSTINSKLKEISRYEKASITIVKKIASLELKISSKQKEIVSLKKRLTSEELREAKKVKRENHQINKKQELNLRTISNTLNTHEHLHREALYKLEKMKVIPEKIVVLFLASNPIDQEQLRLDEKARAISEMIRKSEHRESIEFKTCWAVRPNDILQAINEHNPAIIHFSGHRSEHDEIVFQTNEGKAKLVSKEAIVQTMMASLEDIRLVFFNTCFSHGQAKSVAMHVEAAIGMNTSIGDDAARIFSAQFYSSIGFGCSLKKAFEQAKALLMLESIPEEKTPELFIQDGLNSEEIIIVNPK